MKHFKSIKEYLEYNKQLHSQYIFEELDEPSFPSPVTEIFTQNEKRNLSYESKLQRLNIERELVRSIADWNKAVSKKIDSFMEDGVSIDINTKHGKVTVILTTE